MKRFMLAATLASCFVPAAAHHSAAAFDRSKPFILKGVIKAWEWANPHIWVKIDVPDGKGGYTHFLLEGPSATGMARNGASSHSYNTGDQGKFLVAPYRDGSNRGEFLAAWTADGTQLKF